MTTGNFRWYIPGNHEVMRLDASGNLGISSSNTKPKVFNINNQSEITMNSEMNEMLKITPEGFYVRGVKVPADDNESQAVYEAFKSWLTWASLTRNYNE